jgi:gas vesicle protein
MNGKTLALLALGAAVVLLFTTEKGKEIREDIQDTAGDWSDNLSDLSGKALDEVTTLRKKLMAELDGVTSDVRDRLTTILDEGQARARNLTRMGKERLS